MRHVRNWVHAAFHERETPIYGFVQTVVWLLIALSVGLFAFELYVGPDYPGLEELHRFDRLVLWLFALEISLRVLSYRPPTLDIFEYSPARRLKESVVGRLRYCLEPLNMIDIITVAALVPALRGLWALRLLRLLRTAKIFRYSSPFLGLARSFRENALLFGLAFSFLFLSVLLGGLSFYLIESHGNPAIDSTGDGIWWALVTVTTVGFGDISPVTSLGRIVGGVLMIAGMFTLAMFAGVVGNTLLKSVLVIREEHFRMSGYYDHVLICGYEPGADMLLQALLAEIDPEVRPLVVFAEGERPHDLPAEFVWVEGDPTKESELGKVRISSASAAILVGSRSAMPQQADARTILTSFTIRAYLDGSKTAAQRRRPVYVVAEILDSENVEHALAAGADEVIETRRLGFSLLSHAVTHPGTAALVNEVAVSGAHSIFIGIPPDDYAGDMSFGELSDELKAQKGLLLIGLRDPETGDDLLNPAESVEIDRDTQLLYLAETACLPRRQERADRSAEG